MDWMNADRRGARARARGALAAAVVVAAGLLAGCPPRQPPKELPAARAMDGAALAPVFGRRPFVPLLEAPEASTQPEAEQRARMTLAEIEPLALAALPVGESPDQGPGLNHDQATRRPGDQATGEGGRTSSRPAKAGGNGPGLNDDQATTRGAPGTTQHGPETLADGATSAPPPQAIKYYLQGREKFLEGSPIEAVEYLDKALRLDPNAFDVLKLMGRVCYASNQLSRATLYLQRAAKINAQDVEVNYLLGRHYLATGQTLRATGYLLRALKSPERNDEEVLTPLASFHLARALRAGGFDAAAGKEFERFITLVNREIPSYHYDRELAFLIDELWAVHLAAADDFLHAGMDRAAVTHYEAALEHDPANVYVLTRLAAAEAAIGQTVPARRRVLELVARLHGDEQAVALLEWVYRRTGSAPAAALSADVAAGKATAGEMLALAGLEQRVGHAETAAELLERYLAKEPRDFAVLERLATLGREHDMVEPAFAALVRATAGDLDHASTYLSLLERLTGRQPSPAVLPRLSAVTVPQDEEAAREYLLAGVAEDADAQDAAGAHYEAALAAAPEFWTAREAYLDLLLRRSDYKRAQQVVQTALDSGRGGARPCEIEIDLQMAQQQYAAALKTAESAQDNFPDNAELMLRVADVYTVREQYTEAARQLRRVTERFPDDARGFEGLLNVALASGDRKLMVDSLAMLLHAKPEDRLGLRVSAELLAVSGHPEQGESLLQRLIERDPKDTDTIQALATVEKDAGQVEQAVHTLEEATKTDPPPPALLRQLARYYSENKQGDKALGVVRAAIKAHPDEPAYELVLAGTLKDQGRTAEAIAALKKANETFPQSEAAALALADALLADQSLDAGVSAYQDFIQRSAATADRLYTLSHLQDRAGRRQAAAATLRRVLELLPSHAGAANDLGYYYSEMNENLQQAQRLVAQALDNIPNSAAFVDSMGWVYYKRGEMALAVTTLQRALDLSHEREPDIMRHLGDAMYRTGRKFDAQEMWQRARTALQTERGTLSADERDLRTYLDKVLEQSRNGADVSVTPTAREAATQPTRT